MTSTSQPKRTSLILELVLLTAGFLIIIRGFYLLKFIPIIDKILPLIVAVLLLYGPVAVLWKRKRPIDFLDHGWRKYVRSVVVFIITAVIVFPVFFLCAHYWMVWVYGYKGFHFVMLPDLWNIVAFHLLLVALPEEFYFRGYFQSAMDLILPKKRWPILGARLGWGWLITAVIFAIAHTIVFYQWWHFSIFFPALIFGYLRERTGTITAPILFHAASNILMNWFVACHY